MDQSSDENLKELSKNWTEIWNSFNIKPSGPTSGPNLEPNLEPETTVGIAELIQAIKSSKNGKEFLANFDELFKRLKEKPETISSDEWVEIVCVCVAVPLQKIFSTAETIISNNSINWKVSFDLI